MGKRAAVNALFGPLLRCCIIRPFLNRLAAGET